MFIDYDSNRRCMYTAHVLNVIHLNGTKTNLNYLIRNMSQHDYVGMIFQQLCILLTIILLCNLYLYCLYGLHFAVMYTSNIL